MDRIYQKTALYLACLVIAFLAAYLFASSMLRQMTSDEQMYCTAGYLIAKGMLIYRDFSYIAQMPWHPILLAGIYKLTGTTHYLLAARLASVICDIFIVICVFSIFRKIFNKYYFRGIFAGLAAAVVFVFNPYSNYLLGLAWNHDMVLLCFVLSFRIFIGIDACEKYEPNNKNVIARKFTPAQAGEAIPGFRIFRCSHYLHVAAIASLLTIAVWTRATSIFMLPVFIAMIIAKTRLKYFKAFLTGAIIFSFVPVVIMILSRQAFFINIYKLPVLNSELLHRIGMAYSKFYLTIMALRNTEFLLLLLFAIAVWIFIFIKRRRIDFSVKADVLLAALLVLTSFFIAYFPPTMWKQYLGIPVLFIVISLAYGLFYSLDRTRIWIYAFIAFAIFTAIRQKPFSTIAGIKDYKNWTPVKVHKISKSIIAEAGASKPILTLTPLYAIEGGGQIYRQLSAGAFAFRAAGKLSQEEQTITHSAGLGQICKIIKEYPPAAIVIGPELTRFEKIDLKSLVPEDWQKTNFGDVHCFFPSKN